MPKFFEVRYKKDGEIVAHQHTTERGAKNDVIAQSRSFGTAQIAEIDIESLILIRTCEFAGGVQGKWENRSGICKPVRVLLTVEDTKLDEVELITSTKKELTDEEKAEKREALARLRASNAKKEEKSSSKTSSSANEKRDNFTGKGYAKELIDCLISAGISETSQGFNALVALWSGNAISHVTNAELGDLKSLNKIMKNLRETLVSKGTGKAVATFGDAKNLRYKLVDFKIEEIEEVV